MRQKHFAALWEERKNPYSVAKILDEEITNHPGRFNRILYDPAVIQLSEYNQTNEDEFPGLLRFFNKTTKQIMVETMPVKDWLEIIGYRDQIYDFTRLHEKLCWLAIHGVSYVHVMIEDNVDYNYGIKTSVVIPGDPTKPIGYASPFPYLDEAGKAWMEELGETVKTSSKRLPIYTGKTYFEQGVAMLRSA